MKNSSEKVSYIGQKVFVGIDVHKRNYSVVAVVQGTVVKKWQASAKPDKLAQQLLRYFPGASIHTVSSAARLRSSNAALAALTSSSVGPDGACDKA